MFLQGQASDGRGGVGLVQDEDLQVVRFGFVNLDK
jgi:hypothetical protein